MCDYAGLKEGSQVLPDSLGAPGKCHHKCISYGPSDWARESGQGSVLNGLSHDEMDKSWCIPFD